MRASRHVLATSATLIAPAAAYRSPWLSHISPAPPPGMPFTLVRLATLLRITSPPISCSLLTRRLLSSLNAQATRGEPAIVGIVCAMFWAAVWALLFRWTLPRIRQLPLSTDWGPALLRRQKAVLSDIGFASVAGSMSDDHTADMFAWICLTALVHFVSGCMTLPVVVNGAWEHVSPTGHLVFFTGTWLAIGWSLYDFCDQSLRCFAQGPMRMGLSGMECPCPRSFWGIMCLLNHPFYFALVLPMNSQLADVTQYHTLICAHLLGTGVHLLLRQAALVFDVVGRRARSMLQITLSLHVVTVLTCRGALFFPLIVDCAGYLREVDPESSLILTAPAITMGIVNIVLIIDAIKASLWCSQSNTPIGAASPSARPLRATDSGTQGLDPACDDAQDLVEEDMTTTRSHKSSRPPRSKRSKGTQGTRSRSHSRSRSRNSSRERGLDLDEEMTFDFASSRYLSDDDDYDAGRLGEQPRFSGGSRIPPARSGTARSNGVNRDAAASCASESEADRARARRQADEARRKNTHVPFTPSSATNGTSRSPTAAAGAAAATATASPPEPTVDHSIIFATGKMPRRASHYAMLGVSRGANAEEIKKAFRQLSMRWHPDKNPSDASKAEFVFMGIKEAYDCLSDPTKRRRYDKVG